MRSQPRRAFTLLEILVVIGIIGILVTMVVLGVGHIGKSSREKTTQTVMQNLNGLVTERERSVPIKDLYNVYPPATPQPTAPAIALNPLPAPLGDMNSGGPGRVVSYAGPPGAPVPLNALAATQLVMQKLMAIPDNRQKVSAFASNQVLPANAVPVQGTVPIGITAPLILDAWGNPILYVPGGRPDANALPVDRIGEIQNIFISGAPGAVSKRAPDNRGFWVSAGADGKFGGFHDRNANNVWDGDKDFGFGDDNIYSFEQ